MNRIILVAIFILALAQPATFGFASSEPQAPEITQKEADRLNAKLNEAQELLRPYIFVADANPKKANKEKLEQAIELYDEVLVQLPTHWTTLFFRGKAYQALGEHEHAYRSFKLAFAHHKNNKDVLNEYAVEAMELGYFEEALSQLEKVQRKFKEDIGIRGNYAVALLMTGHVNESLEALLHVQAIWPDDPTTKNMILIAKRIQSKKAVLPKTVRELRAL